MATTRDCLFAKCEAPHSLRARTSPNEGAALTKVRMIALARTRDNAAHLLTSTRIHPGVVARTNRKITTMLHKRATLRSNLRLEATGGQLKNNFKLMSTPSASDKRLNIPSPQPGDRYLQRLKSISNGRKRAKGGSLGKSKRR